MLGPDEEQPATTSRVRQRQRTRPICRQDHDRGDCLSTDRRLVTLLIRAERQSLHVVAGAAGSSHRGRARSGSLRAGVRPLAAQEPWPCGLEPGRSLCRRARAARAAARLAAGRGRRRTPPLGAHASARPDRRCGPGADPRRGARPARLLPAATRAAAPARRLPAAERAPLVPAAPARQPRALGRDDPRLARAAHLRLRGRASPRARPRARELRRCRLPRVDATRRPGPTRAPAPAAADLLRARDAGPRAGCRRRAALQLGAGLRALRASGRAALRHLAADRPAARGSGDDGRAAAHARDLRRAPAAAVPGGPARAAAAPLAVNPPASTSFSFEWLFLVLGAAAVVGYVRMARTVERPSRGRAALF